MYLYFRLLTTKKITDFPSDEQIRPEVWAGWGKMPEVLDIPRRQIFGNLVLVVNCQQHYHDQYYEFQQHDDDDEENGD